MFNFIMIKLFNCKEKVSGRDRQVFVFKNKVIKLPRTESWKDFKRGLKSNREELNTIKNYKGNYPESIPVVISTWFFGICIVMEKYTEVKDTHREYLRYAKRLTILQDQEDIRYVDIWFIDNKVFNYGWDKYGRLVKLDMGICNQ